MKSSAYNIELSIKLLGKLASFFFVFRKCLLISVCKEKNLECTLESVQKPPETPDTHTGKIIQLYRDYFKTWQSFLYRHD